jgi:hypothetical protein
MIIVEMVDAMVGIVIAKETNYKVVEELAAKYKMGVIGEPYILLEMHITCEYKSHTIQLSQSNYIHQILKEFGKCDTVSMPMGPNVIQHGFNMSQVLD